MRIIEKIKIAESSGTRITQFKIESPVIAKEAKPGQFIVLMVNQNGERIPLTLVSTDKKKGTITIIVQEVGFTTKLLGRLDVGSSLYSLVGPLGHATEVKKYGKVVFVGGGVGIAEIYPVTKAFKEAGNQVITILGSRNKDLLILEKELEAISDQLFIATDDGSKGNKGFNVDILASLLPEQEYDLVYAVGPIAMMEKTFLVARDFKVKTLVSLNSLMVDASGMCGSCRVKVGEEVKFACVDGPEFEAGLLDWKELGRRSSIYKDKEEHICRLNNL